MSNFLNINWKDIGKGLLLAVVTPIVAAIVSLLQGWVSVLTGGTLPALPTLETIGSWILVGLAAGLSYLLKNFFTNSQNQLLKPENNITPTN